MCGRPNGGDKTNYTSGKLTIINYYTKYHGYMLYPSVTLSEKTVTFGGSMYCYTNSSNASRLYFDTASTYDAWIVYEKS